MPKVTGIGGVFFKSEDPEKLYAWYERHLGISRKDGFVAFPWRVEGDSDQVGMTVWSLFSRQSDYFSPSESPFMINYRVDDLDGLLDALAADGVAVNPKREDHEYGRFAWIVDPEGNKIELWQPPS